MIGVIKTYGRLIVPVRTVTVVSRDICRQRNVLITNNNVTFVHGQLSSTLMKSTVQLSACWLPTFGQVCQFKTVQSNKLSVPVNGKYTQNRLRHCRVSVAMAVGLLVGWTMLELHQHTVSCVAEATEAAECHDNKEQINHQCHVVSLEEAIHESDQLLQRVKVRRKLILFQLFDYVSCSLSCDIIA